MRARKIHETQQNFTRGGDPYAKLGIGTIHYIRKQLKRDKIPHTGPLGIQPAHYEDTLDGYTPNELLVIGVAEDHLELIKIALGKGANQMWWQSGGNAGAWHGIIKNITDSFAHISKVTQAKDKPIRYHYSEMVNDGNIYDATSTIFKKKYSPVTEDFIKGAREAAKTAKRVIGMIDGAPKEYPREGQGLWPKYNMWPK